MAQIFRAVCSWWLVVGIFGCNTSQDGPPLAPVAGVVTLDDKPLESATVSFIPASATPGQGGMALTDKNGQFEVSTPDLKRKGLAAGSYKVVISRPLNPDGTPFTATAEVGLMDSQARESLPPAYSDFEQTTLTADVPAEGAKPEFKLSSKRQ